MYLFASSCNIHLVEAAGRPWKAQESFAHVPGRSAFRFADTKAISMILQNRFAPHSRLEFKPHRCGNYVPEQSVQTPYVAGMVNRCRCGMRYVVVPEEIPLLNDEQLLCVNCGRELRGRWSSSTTSPRACRKTASRTNSSTISSQTIRLTFAGLAEGSVHGSGRRRRGGA